MKRTNSEIRERYYSLMGIFPSHFNSRKQYSAQKSYSSPLLHREPSHIAISSESSPVMRDRQHSGEVSEKIISYTDAYEKVYNDTKIYYENNPESPYARGYDARLKKDFAKMKEAVESFLKQLDEMKLYQFSLSRKRVNNENIELPPELKRLYIAANIATTIESIEILSVEELGRLEKDLITNGKNINELKEYRKELMGKFGLINEFLQAYVNHFHPEAYHGPLREGASRPRNIPQISSIKESLFGSWGQALQTIVGSLGITRHPRLEADPAKNPLTELTRIHSSL